MTITARLGPRAAQPAEAAEPHPGEATDRRPGGAAVTGVYSRNSDDCTITSEPLACQWV